MVLVWALGKGYLAPKTGMRKGDGRGRVGSSGQDLSPRDHVSIQGPAPLGTFGRHTVPISEWP